GVVLMNILVVEDDQVIGKSLVQGFTEAGHNCELAKNGNSGATLAASHQFDVIVLDLMLPGQHGLDVLRGLRGKGLKSPVILLTALGAVEERVAGLDAGADDYVVKPFAFAELMARVQAIVRR